MFSANSEGIVATAFEVGAERLQVMGKVVYNHHAPFFSFKDLLGCYGFSIKMWFRINTYAFVIWRSIVRK